MPDPHDPYQALRSRPYRLYLMASQAMHWSNQAINVALGWHLYELTGSAWSLGLIGLANYLPIFLFSLPAGLAADRFDRRKILALTLSVMASSSLALAWLAAHPGSPTWSWYAIILLWATARSFHTPAAVSLYPSLLVKPALANAVSWGSSNYQIGAIGGPALAGFIIHWGGATPAFLWGAAGPLVYLLLLPGIRPLRSLRRKRAVEGLWQTFSGGLRFLAGQKVMLTALSLDLVAVLFGGAEALMPMFAKDILHCGPVGLGFLKAAPFAGTLAMGLYLAHRPLERAGTKMIRAVAGFGACMAVFGLSRAFWLSLLALFAAGLMDAVSIVVRQTLVQIRTPERLRGRVQAVNFLFIGSSNELGEFESGMTAAWFGPVASVVGGGILTILIVGMVAWRWPDLGKLDRLQRR